MPNSDEEKVDALLEEGLFLFGADKVDEAIQTWKQVLEISPAEPRAIDYLSSAGVDVASPVTNTKPAKTQTLQGLQPITSAKAVPEPAAKAVPEPAAKAVPEPAAKTVPEPAAKTVPEPTAKVTTKTAKSNKPSARVKLKVAPPHDDDKDKPLVQMEIAPGAPSVGARDPLKLHQPAQPAQPAQRRLWPIALGVILLAGIAAALFLSSSKDTGTKEEVAIAPQDSASVPAPMIIPPAPAELLEPAPAEAPAADLEPSAEAPVAPDETAIDPADEFYRVELRVVPTIATIEIDGVKLGSGGLVKRLPLDGTVHELRVNAPGYEPLVFSFVDASPPAEIRLRAVQKNRDNKRPKTNKNTRTKEPSPASKPKKPETAPRPTPPKPAPSKPTPPRRTDNRDPWQ